jgi:parallel beta-helix repeat protein
MHRKMAAVSVSLSIIICSIMIVVDNVPNVSGTTITVDDDPGADYFKIQDAINASDDGDTVLVYSGVYYETLVVNKAINLTGEDKDTTIVNGMKSNNTVFITSNWVNVTGFTIRNASTSWAKKDGGIKLSSVNNVTVKDNICTNNLIGIMLYNSSYNKIENNDCNENINSAIRLEINSKYNIVKNNKASLNVAGIVLWSGSSYNVISHNNASSNSPFHGINLDTNCHYNNITNNIANSNSDEGIFLAGNNDYNNIRNNTVKSNGDHGIIITFNSDNNRIYHNKIITSTNQAQDDGSSNAWHNGYPSGGNYWSDFDEAAEGAYDDFQGVNQTDLGSDMIVDNGSGAGGGKNPYNVPGGKKDIYPFINPFFNSPPSAVRNLTALGKNGYVNLSWDVPVFIGRFNITSYNIYRNDTPGVYAWVLADQLWYNDTNVINGVTYIYNVSAVSSNGEGPNSEDVIAVPSDIPSAPFNLQAVAGDGHVNLNWDEPIWNGGSSITNYRIYRGTTSGGETFIAEVPEILFYIDSNVVVGNSYYYKVSAVNVQGEGPLSNEANAVYNSVPSEPRNLAVVEEDSSVSLTWNAPTIDGGTPITNYLVYRNRTSDGEVVIFDAKTNLSLTDSSAENGVEYEYSVSAKNAVGEGPKSSGLLAIPTGAPLAPLNLSTVSGNMFANLSWSAPLSDGGSEITAYRIYRNDKTGLFAEVSSAVLWYNDTEVIGNTHYVYFVSATNFIGEGPRSDGVGANPLSVPSVPLNFTVYAGNMFMNLSWSPPFSDGGSNITRYNVYRDDFAGSYYVALVPQRLWYLDDDVYWEPEYTYYISAVNDIGEGPPSEEITVTLLGIPSSPENLQLTAGDGYVYLTWDFAEEDGGSSITNYRIYKGTASDEETFFYEVGNLNYYNDTDVNNNITYYYRITAKNEIGEGYFSNEVSGTPKSTEISEPQPTSEVEEFPVWLTLLHAIVIALIVIALMYIKRRKEEIQIEDTNIPSSPENPDLESKEPEFFEKDNDLPPPPSDIDTKLE